MNNSAIYEGWTAHARLAPVTHRFRYRLFSLLIDLDELPLLERIPFFSHNRRNLVSFHDADHGPRDGSDLKAWLFAQLRDRGYDDEPSRVRMLVLPRIFGYQFNPLTVWFIDGADGLPRWILYEVHNTFGEAHGHLVDVKIDGAARHDFEKIFFVSPFFDVEGRYRVAIAPPAERFRMSIRYEVGDDTMFTASLSGERKALTALNLLSALVRFPLLTVKVMAAIHLEAAKVWLKGARYRRRSTPPADLVSASTRASTRIPA